MEARGLDAILVDSGDCVEEGTPNCPVHWPLLKVLLPKPKFGLLL